MVSRRSRGHTSWLIVPASETSSPEEVEKNAANAPAAVSAPSSVPTVPGHAACGSVSTTLSVCPVMYS
jgi:hypothetical protein